MTLPRLWDNSSGTIRNPCKALCEFPDKRVRGALPSRGLARIGVILGVSVLFCPLAVLAQTPAEGLLEQGLRFQAGRALFQKTWVAAPSSTRASDGLGPLYNARSCERCHAGGGSGEPLRRDSNRADAALVIHLTGSARYGRQLQTSALPGLPAEARVSVDYREFPVSFPDGETVTLREPRYRFRDLSHGDLDSGVGISARLAPRLFGVGRLAAVPAEMILALADEEDRDGDGISGRPGSIGAGNGTGDRIGPAGGEEKRIGDGPDELSNDAVAADDLGLVPGRFGWRAEQSTVALQVAAALHRDMGLGNPLFPDPYGDCTPAQARCRQYPSGGSPRPDDPEASREVLDALIFYVANLPAPVSAWRENPRALKGRELLLESGCGACHHPAFQLEGGLIEPYTDLLLHDMGDALADRRASGGILSTEWRTTPLWGIGSAGSGPYLHDGRARTLLEAVLWHGGEAETARSRFMSKTKQEREAVMEFLLGL